MKQNVSITLDEETVERLNALADETDRNRSWLVEQSVRAYMEELEDLREARKRLEDERLSPSQIRKILRV